MVGPDLSQFKSTYINECFELLGEMEKLLMSLDAEALNAIFRCAHSIKGGAGAFGFDKITAFTHVAEFLLDAMREGKVAATREIVDALLKSVDVITQMVRAAQAGEKPVEGFGDALCDQLQQFVSSAGIAATKAPAKMKAKEDAASPITYSISFKPKPGMFASGNEPLLLLKELQTLGKTVINTDISGLPDLAQIDPELCYLQWEIVLETAKPENAIREVFEFVEDDCALVITSSVSAPAEKPSTPEATKPEASKAAAPKTEEEQSTKPVAAPSTIRVDLEKVDRLVNLVGELVITQSMLVSQARGIPIDQFPDLLRGIDELSQHSRELQEAVMSVRMQPVKSIFSRMPRIVRDLSQKLNKRMHLDMSGENTEVDKTVIELLGDPLTHMIRNSVDHGIETPEKRKAAKKPEEGTIKLTAFHQGGKIIIQISDDGAGINRPRVLQLAKNKKLIADDAQPTDNEIDNLIFKPGFSTAEVVTDISGRGVGMDVVRRNIEGMNGTVSIQSAPGQGSVFTVALPLTLAILDGMIVRVGLEHYIIPIANIIETLKPAAQSIHQIADDNDLINVRGEFVGLLHLGRVFAIPDANTDPARALVVLVENGLDKLGIVVDELIGQQQVVIKSLETNADPVEGISGATILGDGKVSLILDIAQLHKLANRADGRNSKNGYSIQKPSFEARAEA